MGDFNLKRAVLLLLATVLYLHQLDAQLYVDGTTLYVQKNAVLKVDTSFITAKPGTPAPKIRNWGTIAVEGNTQFHADTDYKGQGDLCLLGTSQQTLTTNGIPLKKIDIRNSNNVELGDDLTLQGTLELTSGFLICGNHDLTIDDSVTIIGGSSSSYIRINGTGKVKATVGSSPRTLPIGRNPYLPIILDDGGDKEYTVGVSDKVYANPVAVTTEQTSDVVSETWTIQASGSQSNVSVTLQWDASEEASGFARSASYLSYWENGVSSAWDVGSTASASGSGPYSLTRTVNFSTNLFYFGVGSSGSALPVELNYFNAAWYEERNSAELNWQTSTEINNSHFEIERSFDGQHWEVIGQTEGNGTRFTAHEYRYVDDHLPLTMRQKHTSIYYRLKQVDYNGQFEYSPVRTLHVDKEGRNSFDLWPNPNAGNTLYLSHTDDYQISTMQGIVVESAQSVNQIDISGLDVGTYVILNSKGVAQLFVCK